jgi:hypothetical protein
MIGPETVAAGARLTAAVRLPRAEEAWEPVLFGGMIPIIGAGAILWLIRHAIKSPESEVDPEQKAAEEAAEADRRAGLATYEASRSAPSSGTPPVAAPADPPGAKKEGGPEDPPS